MPLANYLSLDRVEYICRIASQPPVLNRQAYLPENRGPGWLATAEPVVTLRTIAAPSARTRQGGEAIDAADEIRLQAKPAPMPIPALDSATAIDMRDLLANLADFSMIGWDAQKDEITVHRVVQEILRTQQQEPGPVLTAALNMLNAARPKGNPEDVRSRPQWDLLRPHVAFAVAAAEQRGIDDPTSALMGELGSLLSGKALHTEAERLKHSALAIDERAHGPESTQVAFRLNKLATTLLAVNGGEKPWRSAGEKCSALPVGITRWSVAGSSLRGVCSLLRLCAGPA